MHNPRFFGDADIATTAFADFGLFYTVYMHALNPILENSPKKPIYDPTQPSCMVASIVLHGKAPKLTVIH
jgi:hypothetical protein